MKPTSSLVLVAVLLALLPACKPSNRVSFKPALLSIDPGPGWKQIPAPATPPVCSPRLVGKAGMINAVLLEEFTELRKAADHLANSFSSLDKTVPNTLKREDFVTAGGQPGVHVSYTGKSPTSPTPDLRSHSFISRNRRGQCVSISYITSPELESPEVLEGIAKSLRVE